MYLSEKDRPDDDDDDYFPNPNDLLPGPLVKTVPVCEAEIAELKNKIIAAATSVELSGIVIIWTWNDCHCLKQIEEYIGHKYTGKILVPKTMSNDEGIEEAVQELNQSNMTFSYVHIQYGKFQDELLWNEMDSPSIIQYDCLAEVAAEVPEDFGYIRNILQKLVVLKLKTGMECDQNICFDLVVTEIQSLNKDYRCNIPLLIMSPLMDDDTIVEKYAGWNVEIHLIKQSKFHSVVVEDFGPLPSRRKAGADAWCIPDHRDVFTSLKDSGELDALLLKHKEYVFVAKSDHFGAFVDLKILNHLTKNKNDYCMEVTPKTLADMRSGTLISHEGKLQLLDIARVPEAHRDVLEKFKYFNTNNLWIDLAAINRLILEDELLTKIIPYLLVVDGIELLQLDTAAGAAIRFFNHAIGINVPHSRFLPINSTSNLLMLQSDLYIMRDGFVIPNPARTNPANPSIDLGPEFEELANFSRRFKHIPSIFELDSLKGKVTISAKPGVKLNIPSGRVIADMEIHGPEDL